MILFKEIYRRAINLFDDPDIQKAYVTSPVLFEKIMFPYLQNGMNLFHNPSKVVYELLDQDAPFGQTQVGTGTGDSVIQLEEQMIPTRPMNEIDILCMIAGKIDKNAKYDESLQSIIFSQPVPEGTEYSIEMYFGGCYNTDFQKAATSTTPAYVINEKVKDILARATVISWAQEEENFLLDIKNVLTDTDFKVHAPANAIRSKKEWVDGLVFELDSLQNKLSWTAFARSHHGGNFYGR